MNRDILGIVASKLDDETLCRFWLHAGCRDDLRSILTSQLFWHSRCEYVAGRVLQTRPEADWKQIYYILLAIVQDKQENPVHLHALHDYEAMLVVEEIYGRISLARCGYPKLFSTRDARLLERFISDCKIDLQFDYWHIFIRQLDHRSPAIEYLMSIVPELKRNMTDMLRILLDNYRRDLLPFIVQHASEDTDYRSWLLLAAERDHQFVWKDILQYYEPVTNQLLDCIADYDAISIFKEYFIHRRLEVTSLDYYPSPGASFKRDSLSVCSLDADLEAVEIDKLDYILDRAISRRSSKVIAEIEKLLVVDWRRKLLACIDGYTVADRRKYTSVCLSKLDSDADLYSMLARATDRYVAIAILHDKRIRVEKLSVQEVQRLYRLVGTGTVRIAIESNDERISSYLSGTDTYSFVLRYLVFKSRDKESMLDWLITAELDSVALAAASTLDYTVVWNEAIDPLRALFTSLLYPSLSIREIVELMKEAGYSYEGLEKSITLLNLAM